ncbi:MAG: hypothetical protein AB1333_02740 [Patescibacteria group bacterium]
MHFNFKDNICYNDGVGGYITLVSVLVAGAIGVAIAVSVILLGVGSSQTSFANEKSNQAKGLANACAEEALQQIHDSPSFASSGTLTLGQGTCGYSVTNGGGSNRTIISSSTVGTIVRKINIQINQISPTIQILSWQEN